MSDARDQTGAAEATAADEIRELVLDGVRSMYPESAEGGWGEWAFDYDAMVTAVARALAAHREAEQAVDVRSLAVEVVDAVHGYTVEFSNQPERHAQEYDDIEAILTRALRRPSGLGEPETGAPAMQSAEEAADVIRDTGA